MSRHYEIAITAAEYDKENATAIDKTIRDLWGVESAWKNPPYNSTTWLGKDYLSMESPEEFARKVAKAIMIANKGICKVWLEATSLEGLDNASTIIDINDATEIMKEITSML